MKTEDIASIIYGGEGLNVEFKLAKYEIPKSVFETVCAFLNRVGGTILLGVSDSGEIIGIEGKYIQKIKKELTNALNNPQIINPPIYIQPEEVILDGKSILVLRVYESSQVHSTRGIIFDRNNDGDYNTLNPQTFYYYMSELHATCGNARHSAPNRSKGYAYGAHICAHPICHAFQPFVTQTACGFKVI